jgi:hypothetical protein
MHHKTDILFGQKMKASYNFSYKIKTVNLGEL